MMADFCSKRISTVTWQVSLMSQTAVGRSDQFWKKKNITYFTTLPGSAYHLKTYEIEHWPQPYPLPPWYQPCNLILFVIFHFLLFFFPPWCTLCQLNFWQKMLTIFFCWYWDCTTEATTRDKYPILERGSTVLLLLLLLQLLLLLCTSHSGDPPWILEWAGLGSSGRIASS